MAEFRQQGQVLGRTIYLLVLRHFLDIAKVDEFYMYQEPEMLMLHCIGGKACIRFDMARLTNLPRLQHQCWRTVDRQLELV